MDSWAEYIEAIFDQKGVVQFKYDRSIRIWRYAQFALGSIVAAAYLMYQGGYFDPILSAIMTGVVFCSIGGNRTAFANGS